MPDNEIKVVFTADDSGLKAVLDKVQGGFTTLTQTAEKANLGQAFEKAAEPIKKVDTALQEVAQKAQDINSKTTNVGAQFEKAAEPIKGVGQAITEVGKQAEAVGGHAETGAKGFAKLSEAGQKISDVVDKTTGKVTEFQTHVGNVTTAIGGISTAWGGVTQAFSGGGETIKAQGENLKQMAESAGKLAHGDMSQIPGLFGEVMKAAGGLGDIAGTFNNIAGAAKGVKDSVTGLGGTLKTAAEALGAGGAWEKGAEILAKVATTAGLAEAALVSLAGAAGVAFVYGVSKLADVLGDWIQKMIAPDLGKGQTNLTGIYQNIEAQMKRVQAAGPEAAGGAEKFAQVLKRFQDELDAVMSKMSTAEQQFVKGGTPAPLGTPALPGGEVPQIPVAQVPTAPALSPTGRPTGNVWSPLATPVAPEVLAEGPTASAAPAAAAADEEEDGDGEEEAKPAAAAPGSAAPGAAVAALAPAGESALESLPTKIDTSNNLLGKITDNIVQLGVDAGKIGNDTINAIEQSGRGGSDGGGGGAGGGGAGAGAGAGGDLSEAIGQVANAVAQIAGKGGGGGDHVEPGTEGAGATVSGAGTPGRVIHYQPGQAMLSPADIAAQDAAAKKGKPEVTTIGGIKTSQAELYEIGEKELQAEGKDVGRMSHAEITAAGVKQLKSESDPSVELLAKIVQILQQAFTTG